MQYEHSETANTGKPSPIEASAAFGGKNSVGMSHPSPQRLKLSVQLVNQLLSERTHQPDAVRLLRQILRERAISQPIKDWSASNRFG